MNGYQKTKLILEKKPILEEIAKRNQDAKSQQGHEGFQSITAKYLTQMNRVNEVLGEQIGVSRQLPTAKVCVEFLPL